MTKTFQGSIVTSICDSGFHLVLKGRLGRQVNHTASLKSIDNNMGVCKHLCQQKGSSSIKLPSSKTDNPSIPPIIFIEALWVEFIDLSGSSSFPFPGRCKSIRLAFCLAENKLQDENRIKKIVFSLALDILTLMAKKILHKAAEYCRISERSWPSLRHDLGFVRVRWWEKSWEKMALES